MIDRQAPARAYFHLALMGVLLPVVAFPITALLAWRAWSASSAASAEPAQRLWTRRLALLAVVDLLVTIATIALLSGKAPLTTPQAVAPPGPRIGVVLDREDTGHGARVAEVHPGSPAAHAGLAPGDVIERVDGQPIARNIDLTETIATTAAGGSRALEVARGAARVRITVVPEVIRASVERRSIFDRDGPREPLRSGLASLAAAWLAVAVLLGIVGVHAARRGVTSPRPWVVWLAVAGALAASNAALLAAHLGTDAILGGGSLGAALLGLVAGSATLLIFAALLRRGLGFGGDPGGARALPTIVVGVGYMIAGVMRVGVILPVFGAWLRFAPPDPGREIHDLVGRGLGPVGIALLIFAAVILAPIGEETLFRGVLLPWLRRFLGPDAAVGVSAILFGLGHLRYGAYLSTIVVYGLVLGWARLHTGNLRASIVLHMIINAVATGVALSRS